MSRTMSSNTKFYVNGYDISGDGASIEINGTSIMGDDTSFTATGHTHQKGIMDDQMTYEGFYDDSAASNVIPIGNLDAIFSALRASTSQNDVVSAYPNTDALGKKGYSGHPDMSVYTIPPKIAELLTAKANFGIEGGIQIIKSLGAQATVTGTTHGTGIDDGVSSALGGSWYYHIFAITATGGNAQIQVALEDSADNVNFTTVGTESYNVTAAGGIIGARHDFTGTLREYVRVSVIKDCTTLSCTYQAGYHRN